METEFEVLLIEDDMVDVLGFTRALRKSSDPVNLHVVAQGEEAFQFLEKKEGRGLPNLIVLDLNMPIMGGLEFLGALKSDPALRQIPVVVMTTSSERKDIERSYDLGAAGYMVKPLDHEEFVTKVKRLHDYWKSCEKPDFKIV